MVLGRISTEELEDDKDQVVYGFWKVCFLILSFVQSFDPLLEVVSFPLRMAPADY